jgi:hypothetical protein
MESVPDFPLNWEDEIGKYSFLVFSIDETWRLSYIETPVRNIASMISFIAQRSGIEGVGL